MSNHPLHQEGTLVDTYVTQCWQGTHTCPESSRLPDFCFFSRHHRETAPGELEGTRQVWRPCLLQVGQWLRTAVSHLLKAQDRKTLSKWSIKCSRQGTEFYSEFPEHNWLEQHKACRSPASASITSGLTGFCRGTVSSHVHLAYLKTQLKPGLMWHCSSHPASSRPSVCFHRPHHHPHKKIKQKKHFKPKETNVYLWGLNMVPVTSALGSGMLP